MQPIAAISYALCLAEIVDEMRRQERPVEAVYVASAGSTGAGLALGKALLGVAFPVRSICPIRWPWDTRDDMANIANQAAVLLGLPHRITGREIEATDDFIGAGYGVPSQEGWEAMDLIAHRGRTPRSGIHRQGDGRAHFRHPQSPDTPGRQCRLYPHRRPAGGLRLPRQLVAMHPERFNI